MVSQFVVGFGLRASGFGLRASGFGLRASGFEGSLALFRLSSAFQIPTARFEAA